MTTDRIELPCEKNKFGAGLDFALAWIDMGSTRYSPDKDNLQKLHIDAGAAVEEKQRKAES